MGERLIFFRTNPVFQKFQKDRKVLEEMYKEHSLISLETRYKNQIWNFLVVIIKMFRSR